MDPSDQELFWRIAAGDQAAFAAFYDRHAPRVYGLLSNWLGRHPDAEDVLQATFWQVWRQAERFDGTRCSPCGWLALLARSRAVDHLRQRRAASPPLPAEVAHSADPAAPLERAEACATVRAALTGLPEEQRSAIALAFFGGLTYEQVARRLGLPLGTVKTRIRLGMNRLRGLLPGPHEVLES